MILQGDCLQVLSTMDEKSIQTCVTSPPYYGLRDYSRCECATKRFYSESMRTYGGANRTEGVGGNVSPNDPRSQKEPDPNCLKCGGTGVIIGTDKQIGLEDTPEAYVEKLVAVFREVRRVLKDTGTLWLNLGDSYWGGKGSNANLDTHIDDRIAEGRTLQRPQTRIGNMRVIPTNGKHDVIKPKDLIGIPWMVAFALRADGWYLRSDIIWHKPNPMPESVTDRPTKSHEYIFLMSKSAQYYYDAEAIAEASVDPESYTGRRKRNAPTMAKFDIKNLKNAGSIQEDGTLTHGQIYESRNKRTVWTVTTKPYKGAHFATFPPDLIEPCILAGTSAKGECPHCGKTWVRVIEYGEIVKDDGSAVKLVSPTKRDDSLSAWSRPGGKVETVVPNAHREVLSTTWKPQCECGADPIPQKVLDPFNGSGTTGSVAIKHHRDYIGIELNPDYIKLSEKRFRQTQYSLI